MKYGDEPITWPSTGHLETTPTGLAANGLINPFTGYKKFQIQCGHCGHNWTAKVIANLDSVQAYCPSCNARNSWSMTAFMAEYERQNPT